jgi:ubiquinone/menaquinone biosynthesis C-methylase UbiE
MGRALDKFVEESIENVLDPEPKERVLEIGCGAGSHLLLLNKLGLDINGVDASPYMISIARKRLGDRCILKTGMAEELPFDDNEFDLAVFINSLEFLDDPLKALREAGRVAKRKVFICVINSLSWYCLCDKLHGLFFKTISKHIVPYHIWGLKSHVRRAYGPVLIDWRSEKILPFITNRISGFPFDTWLSGCSPFGAFLALSATIDYRFKTDNLPLKIRVEKAGQSVASGISTVADLKRRRIP